MSTSIFDPSSFLDASLDAPSEKRPPLPVGDYTAVVGDVTARQWQSKDGSKSGIAWDIPLAIEIPAEVQAATGMNANITLKDSLFLDLTDNGTINNAPGKNGRLRAYREAVDLNKAGDVFSARKMTGKVIRVAIKHELWEDNIQERIGAVTRA